MVLWVSWFSVIMSSFGLSFSARNIGRNVYFNSAVLALCDVPGYILSLLSDQPWAGRRLVQCGSLVLAGTALLLNACPSVSKEQRLALSLIGKLALACAFSNVYVLAG